jgi:hypothetical protein
MRAIVLLKFAEMEPLADVVRENRIALEADVIVPVPLHKIRRRERGFNQAEMLSKRLAKQRKLPYRTTAPHRTAPRSAFVDILPAASGEDSYGVSLVLRDGFGGFLPQPPCCSGGQLKRLYFSPARR